MSDQLRIAYISRAHPPVIGGLEQHNAVLADELPRVTPTISCINTRGKYFLPIFLPYATLWALWHLPHYDLLLLGDALLMPIGTKVRLLSNKAVVTMVHGLDITYRNAFYQAIWVRFCSRFIDGFITVSSFTKELVISHGIPSDRIRVIHNGIYETPLAHSREEARELITLRYGLEAEAKILSSLGRLVERKGAYWFLSEVFDTLPKDTVYLIAGGGRQHDRIAELIASRGWGSRVQLLGRVSDAEGELLIRGSDLFIQPNIAVSGDAEGFGIAAVEAAHQGTVVVASNIEGLSEALNTTTAVLLPSGDARAWTNAVTEWLMKSSSERAAFGDSARQYTVANQTWGKILPQYLSVLTGFWKSVVNPH